MGLSSRLFFLLVLVATSVGSSLTSASAAVPGSTLWAKLYDGPRGADSDYAADIAVSPGGSMVFVTGQVGGDYDYATVAYATSTGAVVWAKRYNGPVGGLDGASAVDVSPDGATVFVTGWSTGTTAEPEYATVAYNAADGARLWAKRYRGAGVGSIAYALGVSPDGSKVFVTGDSGTSTTYRDFGTVAYHASTGSKLWAKRYNGPANGPDGVYFGSLAVSPNGSAVFVSGYSPGSASGDDYATVAYNADTGAQLWVKRYNGPSNGNDYPSGETVSPDGSAVFVTGTTNDVDTSDYATVAYDASTGSRLWVKIYDGSGNSFDFARALGVSPDGSAVFVTGGSAGTTDYDYATIAYGASTGAKLWAKRYNGPANLEDQASALAVSPDGTSVFVTGSVYAATKDYATVAYSASSGAQRWARRYDDPAGLSDSAVALTVGPRGSRVFVTGSAEDPSGLTGSDYATVAYAT